MTRSTVCIRRLARFYCARDWSWDVAGRSLWTHETGTPVSFNYNLWTVLEGAGRLNTATQEFALASGSCFILRGDEAYCVRHEPADPLVVFAVHFDVLDRRGAVVFPSTQLYRPILHLDFLAHLFERMENAWHRRHEDAEFWLSACLREIDQQDRESAEHGFRRRQADQIKAMCREIRKHPGRAYPVGELAARMHCSRFHFSRRFKEITGQSPVDFVVEARIEAARGLLHSSSYSIGRIAELLGYGDAGFFSRQFKKRTGIAPSEYRR
jgi:AraC family transcriptional regulator, arabinose operon regulatory protein